MVESGREQTGTSPPVSKLSGCPRMMTEKTLEACREKAREEKMRQLEAMLSATDSASETAWKAGEDSCVFEEPRIFSHLASL